MDMISKMELEDALKVHSKVVERIKAVAIRVATRSGEFSEKNLVGRSWEMSSFHVNLKEPDEDMQHLRDVSVNVRLVVYVYGNEDDDDSERKISRTVRFPYRYLLEEGWDEEVSKKGRNRKRMFARIHLDGMKKRIEERTEELAKAKIKLTETEAIAAEPDEDVVMVKIFKARNPVTGRWVGRIDSNSGWTYSDMKEYATGFPSHEALVEYIKNPAYDDCRGIEIIECPVFRIVSSYEEFKWYDIEADSFIGALDKFCDNRLYVYDADNCGNDIYSFAVTDASGMTKYFNVEHSWIDTPEWVIQNTFDVKEVEKSAMTHKISADRNWLVV